MDDLEYFRKKIDDIDREMIALFEERMNTVCDIANYKFKNNLPVLNQGREDEVILKAVNSLKNKGYSESVKAFIKNLMEIGKLEQERIISKK